MGRSRWSPTRPEACGPTPGTSVTGGASASIGSFAHLAGSLTWSSALDATPSSDTEGAGAVLRPAAPAPCGRDRGPRAGAVALGGAHARPTGRASVHSSPRARRPARRRPRGGSRAQPGAASSGARRRSASGTARATSRSCSDQGAPTESVWAGGLGLHLSRSGDFVRAALDLALEKGTREDADPLRVLLARDDLRPRVRLLTASVAPAVRVYFHTFGCKANQYDTERMRQEAEARGARAVAVLVRGRRVRREHLHGHQPGRRRGPPLRAPARPRAPRTSASWWPGARPR